MDPLAEFNKFITACLTNKVKLNIYRDSTQEEVMNKNLIVWVVFSGFYFTNASAEVTSSFSGIEDAPTLQRNILKIPRVDTLDQVGKYQNVEFKLAADGRWDLLQVSEVQPAYINEIEIEIIQSDPVQVHVLVSGDLPSPCYLVESINKRYADELFEISVNVGLTPDAKEGMVCPQVLQPFDIVVPLEVYGLPAGSYKVYLNGKSASFILDKDTPHAESKASLPRVGGW